MAPNNRCAVSWAAALLITACTNTSVQPDDPGTGGDVVPGDLDGAGDAARVGDGAGGDAVASDPWATLAPELDRLVAERCTDLDPAAGVVGAALNLDAYVEIGYLGNGPSFVRLAPNGRTADTVQPIASASKWVSAVAVVEALYDPDGNGIPIDDRDPLDDTLVPDSEPNGFAFLAGVQPWRSAFETVSFAHLLSFTSGLHYRWLNDTTLVAAPWDTCANALTDTDTGCAVAALSERYGAATGDGVRLNAPGEVFSYGSLHMEVAAAGVEERTGLDFQAILDRYVNTPLGLEGVTRLRFPHPIRTDDPTRSHPNPLIAGGIRAGAATYRRFLEGVVRPTPFTRWQAASPDTPRTVGLERSLDPSEPVVSEGWEAEPWGYALGHWVQGGGILSSAGMSGFYPWYDPATDTYGIIATDLGLVQNLGGFPSVRCGLQLQQAIRACLIDEICR